MLRPVALISIAVLLLSIMVHAFPPDFVESEGDCSICVASDYADDCLSSTWVTPAHAAIVAVTVPPSSPSACPRVDFSPTANDRAPPPLTGVAA